MRHVGVLDQGGRSGVERNCWVRDLFLKVRPTGFPDGLNEGCESVRDDAKDVSYQLR